MPNKHFLRSLGPQHHISEQCTVAQPTVHGGLHFYM